MKTFKLILTLIICLLFAMQSFSQDTTYNGTKFIENNGQVADSNLNPIPEVLFYAEIYGGKIYLMEDSIPYIVMKYAGDSTETDSIVQLNLIINNMDSGMTVQGENQEDSVVNHFYLAHIPAGVTNVKEYNNVRYADVYSNIDLVFNMNKLGLDYTFHLSPNSSDSDIEFEFQYARSVSINNSGDLEVNNNLRNLVFKKPYVEEIEGSTVTVVPGQYVLNGTKIGISIQNFSSSKSYRASIIQAVAQQPVGYYSCPLYWSTYYGSTNYDAANCIVSYSAGNMFVTGKTDNASDLVVWTGPQPYAKPARPTMFISKFKPTGVRYWNILYAGSDRTWDGGSFDGWGSGKSLAIDKEGRFVVTGVTYASDFPTWNNPAVTNNYYQSTKPAGAPFSAFLIKFYGSGIREWATYFSGAGGSDGKGVATDNDNHIIMVGHAGAGLPVKNHPGSTYHQATPAAVPDAFIASFDKNGVQVFCTYFGGVATSAHPGGIGKSDEIAYKVVTNSANDIILAGLTGSDLAGNVNCGVPTNEGFPLCEKPGTPYFDDTYGGYVFDAFIAKFSNHGHIQWSTYVGINGNDRANALSVDANDNIYLGLYTTSPGLPVSGPPGAYQQTKSGFHDVYIMKFNPQLQRVWSTYIGGLGGDVIANSYVTNSSYTIVGGTSSSDYPTVSPLQGYKGQTDGFLSEFSLDAVLEFSTHFGGSKSESINDITYTGSMKYIVGQTDSDLDFPLKDPMNGAYIDFVYGGTDLWPWDAFIAQIGDCEFEPKLDVDSEGNFSSIEKRLRIYPNPAFGKVIKIENPYPDSEIKCEIFDLTGRVIWNIQNPAEDSFTLDLSELANGLYILHINTGGVDFHEKLILFE